MISKQAQHQTEREISYEILSKNPTMKGSQLRHVLKKDFDTEVPPHLTANWVYLFNHRHPRKMFNKIEPYIPIKKTREEEIFEFKRNVYEAGLLGEEAIKKDELIWKMIAEFRKTIENQKQSYLELETKYHNLNKDFEQLKVNYMRLKHLDEGTLRLVATAKDALCTSGD
jgi:hypothetical protein